MAWNGLIERYGSRMALEGKSSPVTLHEGNTPLLPAPRLAAWIGGGIELFLKYEGLNPTGSFKDRGMTAAVTDARARGAKVLICASTGNTAASAAAYAARAGLRCFVLIPAGKVALGKLAAAVAYGAEAAAIDGSFDRALELVREASELEGVALVNSLNPARIEGQKTAPWEIIDALGSAPDWLALPVGNAGNITSYWRGFVEVGAAPRLLGVQAEGAAPIVRGEPVEHPETKATAIRIGKPARWEEASRALRESGGRILAVSDEAIFEAYREVARREGVFCEPSSAAGLAGLRVAVAEDPKSFKDRRIVAVLTGHGLKDPDSALSENPPLRHIPATTEGMRELLR